MDDNVFNRISVEIKKTYYVCERYKLLATFVLVYHEENLEVTELSEFVRMSDYFIKIDENHYFLNFTYTSQEDAFKASQNLLLDLDNHFNNTTSCIAIDTFDPSNSPTRVMSRLMQIMKVTRQNSFTRIEDECILNKIY